MNEERSLRGAQHKSAAPRYATTQPALNIAIRTLGSPVSYNLSSANISKSGLLMENHSRTRIPFNVNTLVEIDIDIEGNWLQRPIQCVGKVIRLAQDADGNAQFGIKIVQIDGSESDVWESCFRQLEQNARHLVMHDKRLLPPGMDFLKSGL